MNKGIIIAIVAVIAVVGAAGAFLNLQSSQAITPNLVAKEFGYEGLEYKLADNQNKGGPTIQAKVGQTVRIVLKNEGTMEHEFMVVEDLMAEMQHESVFEGAMSEATKPGQTSTITFKAEKPGKYFYGCFLDEGTKPEKHADKGMFGELIVEA